MTEPNHGTTSGYAAGCRCEWCAAARRAYMVRYKAQIPAEMTHGAARYNRGCRCDECRAAASARVIGWMRRVGIRPATQRFAGRSNSARARLERARIGLAGVDQESRAG